MSHALPRPMTPAEFLAWEARQELRFEFDGMQPVAMAGGTAAHAAIQRNLLVALATRLRGGPCRPYGSDLKVQAGNAIRYPDAFVVCAPVPPGATIVTDPVVVFEVLSNATAGTDRIRKNQEYRDTPSIRRYVMLEQDAPGAVVFAREGGEWVGHVHGADAVLTLPELGIELPLAELYEGSDIVPRA